MDDADKAAFEAAQAERAELGLPVEPEAVEPAETIPTVEPEAKPETVEPTVEPNPEEPATEPKEDPTAVSKSEPQTFKDYKAHLRAELQKDYDEKVEKLKEEYEKGKPNETVTENLEDDVKALAKELDFDEDKTRKLIEVARKGISINPEDKKLLDELKTERERLAELTAEKEQEAIFEEDIWKPAELALKAQYPNATPDQWAIVKDQLDELSHSEKYVDAEVDYILFKEKELLGKTLFSPKQATFESARPASTESGTDEWPEITDGMTPAQLEALDKKRDAILSGMPGDRVKVTTRDDSGHIVEYYE